MDDQDTNKMIPHAGEFKRTEPPEDICFVQVVFVDNQVDRVLLGVDVKGTLWRFNYETDTWWPFSAAKAVFLNAYAQAKAHARNKMKISLLITTALVLGACTVHSDLLTRGDAGQYYVAPTLCEKQQSCAPLLFIFTYSASADAGIVESSSALESCKVKMTGAVEDKNKLSGCTNTEWQTCRTDLQKAECPTDLSAFGIPNLPSSCLKC